MADTIENHGDIDVHDLVLHTEVYEHGDWHSVTVYFTPAAAGNEPDSDRAS